MFEGVVPIDQDRVVLGAAEAAMANRSHLKLASWLTSAEALWNRHSSGNLSLRGRFDFHKELSAQFPIPKLRVVYAKAGTQPAACIVRDDAAVIDHMLYWSPLESEAEGHFLSAVINSETTRARAEQFQARGQFGARHFDKVIWNLPIPRFDPKNKLHLALAKAGARAEDAAQSVELVEGEKFQRARKRVRDSLAEAGISAEIDALVEKLLDGA